MRLATTYAASAVAIVVIAGCTGGRGAGDEHDAEAMRRHTVPDEARALVVHADERGVSSIRSRWEFQIDWEWARFATWVRASMDSRFSDTHATRGLAFGRRLAGDVQRVSIEPIDAGPPLRVRVEFASHAD